MDLIPITINKTLVAKAEGHYYKANCDFKTSISEKSSETTIEIKSITYDLYNHIGDYTIDDGITVGYFTPGLVDWDKCTVCGYEGKGPNAIPLTGTTWLSTGPVNAYGISNKFLQIEFSDNTLANISVKDSKDSEAKVIESDCRYDVQFDYVAGTATINIYGLYAPNYGGPATENLKNGQIEINNKAFNDGKLTFEKIIED